MCQIEFGSNCARSLRKTADLPGAAVLLQYAGGYSAVNQS